MRMLARCRRPCGNEIDTSTAASAAEALERLEQLRPDLLLVDIGMPERDGYALIETIRSGSGPQASVPALAVTAYAGVKDRARALRAGFDGHVPKPVDRAALLAAVASALARTDPASRSMA